MGWLRTPTERAAALLSWLLLSACATPPNAVEAPRLGQAVDSATLTRQQLNVFPDGRGLPPGRGTVSEGAALFARHCAACHGKDARGGSAEELAGATRPLNTAAADKTIGSYWPYATTLFDFIRRAKPMTAPATLSADEVYALSAWLLHINGVIAADAVMDARTLPAVRMPNRDGFIRIEAN
ncbi:MAG: c-type cytochrome [Methyloversatilis discipulorum]|uniref:c-type cytochrome n=1 Tax=Methyloversatilis discipulorum TaxID=1119528 RepID=UPI0026EBADE3|nr:cytochrome c [Methyloversatilis discipulorum]MBV5287799.1 c-type cytochrome [Methyloversatilis discipulorum]